MLTKHSIYTELSKKYGIPYQIVEVICNSPFRFANAKITALDDKPIRFAYLGKIKMKKIHEKANNSKGVPSGDIPKEAVGDQQA